MLPVTLHACSGHLAQLSTRRDKPGGISQGYADCAVYISIGIDVDM